MAIARSAELIRRFDAAEECLCLPFNRWSRQPLVRVVFATVSRLGNGLFWYALILSAPLLFGTQGLLRAAQIACTGLAGVALYKCLKRRFARERPYISHLRISAGAAPLDRFSFPSGHTLHAVCFAVLFSTYFPILTWVVVPFAMLVAVSRLVLGLHYPTDVVVGALIGAGTALLSMGLVA
jgi:undecaprenyl-diphosphatase